MVRKQGLLGVRLCLSTSVLGTEGREGLSQEKHIWDLSDLKLRERLERKGDTYVCHDELFTNMA